MPDLEPDAMGFADDASAASAPRGGRPWTWLLCLGFCWLLGNGGAAAQPYDGGVPPLTSNSADDRSAGSGAAQQRDPGASSEAPAEQVTASQAGSEPASNARPSVDDDQRAQDGLVPPVVVDSPPPAYPEAEIGKGEQPSVILHVVVDASGQVKTAHVDHSAGSAFDAAALTAVRGWRFRPALKDGQAIPSSVHVAVHFRLPQFDLDHVGDGEVLPETTSQGASFGPEPFAPQPGYGAQAQVEQTRLRTEERAASDITIDGALLRASPRQEGAEALRSAPGLYIGRGEGQAVGHSFMLRGFDADHGQDLALSVGGLPINLPSHIHGQGYSDLGFLIGETIASLRVSEGVYDPAQGDFAVAGSIDVDLGVQERGIVLKSGYGSFATFRELILWAPQGEDTGTFAAATLQGTNGFGVRRASRSASAIAQVNKPLGHWAVRAVAIASGARGDMAGVLRRDDIDVGRVNFYGAYNSPTARSQSALNTRVIAGLFAEYRGPQGDNGSVGLHLGHDTFSAQQNFTGFTQRSNQLLDVAGRGDLIAQKNDTSTIGLSARYRSATFEPLSALETRAELGLQARLDMIEQSQKLVDGQRNQIWDERVDADIRQSDLGLWVDLEAELLQQLSARIGVRADALFVTVDDRLQNLIPLTRRASFIEGYQRTAGGVAWGPRTSLAYPINDSWKLMAAYGEGYRSPQARTLEDGEQAPFTKVRSADIGTSLSLGEHTNLRLVGYWTHLSDDAAFDAEEGSLTRIGESQRMGAVLYGQTRPTSWFLASGSVTYVDAELLEPPAPSASDPSPAFESGQNLPFVPPIVARLDLGVTNHLPFDLLGVRPKLNFGLGMSYLSKRPLPYGAFAAPVELLDASLRMQVGAVSLSFEAFNLLDAQYASVEYNFVSQWTPATATTRLPARHISAGAPRTFMATLEGRL